MYHIFLYLCFTSFFQISSNESMTKCKIYLSSFYYPVASGFLQLTPSNKFSHFMFLLLSNFTKYQKDGTWVIYLRCAPLLRVPVKCETKQKRKRIETKRRYISFRSVSFDFVSFLFRFSLYRYPLLTVGLVKMKSQN